MSHVQRILGKNFKFEIGSTTIGMLQVNEEFIKEQIVEGAYHKHFDFEKFYNELYGEERSQFKKAFDKQYINPLMKDLDSSLEQLFNIDYKKNLLILK